jgi:RHS repeat-associated protein
MRYVDELICENTRVASTTARVYAMQDANFNVTASLNTSGAVQQRRVYDPYGTSTEYSASWTSPSTTITWNYQHQGGRYESATGLYNFRNRDYHPMLGAWIQRDPKGLDAGDWNLYGYVGRNPVNAVDPSGEDCPGCDVPTGLGRKLNSSDCTLACCAQHDQCYLQNNCTAASWNGVVGGYAAGGALGVALVCKASPCDKCDINVAKCIAQCATEGTNHMAGQPLYFCANTGKNITVDPQPWVPGEDHYSNIDKAKAACCNS